MDKVREYDSSFNNGIVVTERKSVTVSGVKKIERFDDEEFLIDTTLGFLNIKGKELELIKLDTYQGNVNIKGSVDSFIYLDDLKKKDVDSSFWGKLFK